MSDADPIAVLRDAATGAGIRFWSKVTRDESGCWLWMGGKSDRGYGRFTPDPRRNQKRVQLQAHRYAYEYVMGTIPEGLTLDHLCEVKACVNPWHLQPVTMRENVLRGGSPSAVNSRKTHCHNNHEFTEENTVWVKTPTGRGRKCRTCEQAKRRARYLATRGASA